MATSSKVRFRLTDLQAKAVEAADDRVARIVDHLERLKESQEAQRVQWRIRAEAAVLEFSGVLAAATDEDLAKFRVPPRSSTVDHDLDITSRALARALSDRDSTQAKAAALVPDEDGTIALTKNQLSEFFAL